MLYSEMNINQKINFKSWRLGCQKLFKHDYFPKEDDFHFWGMVKPYCERDRRL